MLTPSFMLATSLQSGGGCDEWKPKTRDIGNSHNTTQPQQHNTTQFIDRTTQHNSESAFLGVFGGFTLQQGGGGVSGRLAFFSTVAAVLVFAPLGFGAAATHGERCLSYGYVGTAGGEHYSHLVSDTYAFGGELWLVTDCDLLTVTVDGQQVASTNSTARVHLAAGFHNLTFSDANGEQQFVNVMFVPMNDFEQALGYLPAEQNRGSILFTASDLAFHEVMIAAISALILWGLVVAVLSRLVRVWVAYRFVEEVRA